MKRIIFQNLKRNKKSTHIKSQSNISIYSKQISERPFGKKQYSGSKSKGKKSISRHGHQRSKNNISGTKYNKRYIHKINEASSKKIL